MSRYASFPAWEPNGLGRRTPVLVTSDVLRVTKVMFLTLAVAAIKPAPTRPLEFLSRDHHDDLLAIPRYHLRPLLQNAPHQLAEPEP